MSVSCKWREIGKKREFFDIDGYLSLVLLGIIFSSPKVILSADLQYIAK